MRQSGNGDTEQNMKCLIFSDSHGSIRNVESVLSMHSDAEVVFFLGDGLSEIDLIASKHPDKFWIAVRGNCDLYSYFGDEEAKKTETITLGGFRITATHGDLYDAKYGSAGLIRLARDTESDIILFGHTHRPYEKYISDYEKPFYLFNPGSISMGSGSFGLLLLDKAPLFSHGEII